MSLNNWNCEWTNFGSVDFIYIMPIHNVCHCKGRMNKIGISPVKATYNPTDSYKVRIQFSPVNYIPVLLKSVQISCIP